tara:strand:- start:145 stop:291 length:147 start_codon:yes stop_codon:yes gene_type:complete
MIYQNSGCDDGLKLKPEAYRICFFVNNQNIFFYQKAVFNTLVNAYAFK